MKTILPKLSQCKSLQLGALFAVVAVVVASLAASRPPQASVKLEGAWVAQTDNGIRSLVTYGPSDPSGRSATFRNEMVWPPELLASVGIDAVTDEIAEESVTGPKTSTYTGIWYGLHAGRIALIFLDDSVITRHTPTYGTIQSTVTVYLATADADNNGYPDPGSEPFLPPFSAQSITTRVTH
jgi:hypothetical protein